jgi:hypothetical protein
MSKKISELSDAATLDGTEQVELVQAGGNVKATVNDLLPVQLQENKTIDLNGKDLHLTNGEADVFNILLGSFFTSLRQDSGDLDAYLFLSAVEEDAAVFFKLNSTDGINTVYIEGNGIENVIEYTAGAHVFEGISEFADDAAAAIGGVPVNGLYHTAGAVKIRLS